VDAGFRLLRPGGKPGQRNRAVQDRTAGFTFLK
jgi:hypothetical protein